MKRYTLKIQFTEPMLGSSPADPKVYEQFIAARKRSDQEDAGEEVATLPAEEIDKAGTSVYHRDDTGLFIFDYKIRGFLKESAIAVTERPKAKPKKGEVLADPTYIPEPDHGMSAVKSKIDKWVFVMPRKIYLYAANGNQITTPDDTLQRPIRAMTAQGPRITLKKSETVNEGTALTCEIVVLPLGEREINEDRLRAWLDYGQFSGIGEWRSGSYGRFQYELVRTV